MRMLVKLFKTVNTKLILNFMLPNELSEKRKDKF